MYNVQLQIYARSPLSEKVKVESMAMEDRLRIHSHTVHSTDRFYREEEQDTQKLWERVNYALKVFLGMQVATKEGQVREEEACFLMYVACTSIKTTFLNYKHTQSV